MTETPRPPTGPRNRFEQIWRSGSETKTKYSLIKIPKGVPVSLSYVKEDFGLDFVLTPTADLTKWSMAGTIDADIISLLGLPVSIPRRGRQAPMLTVDDIDALRDYGEVDDSTPGIFDVSLDIPTEHVHSLLAGLWQPRNFRGKRSPIVLGDTERDFRVLPQKVHPNGEGASLTVIRRLPEPEDLSASTK